MSFGVYCFGACPPALLTCGRIASTHALHCAMQVQRRAHLSSAIPVRYF